MFFLLYGPDNFRTLQKLHQLIKQFKQQKQGDIITLESENLNLTEFQNHLLTQSLFTTDKLIICKNWILELDQTKQDQICQLLVKKSINTSVIFFERETVKKNNPLLQRLLDLSSYQGKHYYPEFKHLTHQELRQWIVKRLAKHQKQIDPTALNYLLDACSNTWEAYQETQKIIVQPDNPITETTIQNLVIPKFDDNIFHLTDAIVQKNSSLAFQLLTDQLNGGAEPIYLLSMIARQIRILIKVKSATQYHSLNPYQLSKLIDEHPFVIKKVLATSLQFDLNRLLDIYQQILITDQKLKSSRLSPQTLLSKLVYDIINF